MASQITGGVNIVDSTFQANNGGPYLMGGTYASPTGSTSFAHSNLGTVTFIDPGSPAETAANLSKIRYDADIISQSGSLFIIEVPFTKSNIDVASEEMLDYDNLTSVNMTGDELANIVSGTNASLADIASSNTKLIRRLTQNDTPGDPESGLLKLYFATTNNFV